MAPMTLSPTRLSRDILKLSGPDTKTLLQGLLTANLDHLAEGRALYAALLTPQGKILETLFLTMAGEDIYADLPQGRGPGFLKKLMLYRLRAKVEMSDVTADYQAGASPDEDSVPEGAISVAPDPRHAELGFRWLAPRASGIPDTEDTYLAHQLTLGIPDMGAGFGEAEAFPLDVNLDALHGIDHKKGCFVGQEVASRMFRKGEIRKRTYIVRGDNLSPGTSLKQDERTVGEVRHVSGGEGLALVRLDRLDGEVAMAEDTPVTLHKPDYLP